MHIDTSVETLHRQLAAAAALGDEQTRRIAQALAETLDPAVRLTLVRAVSEFADEATAALLDLPGSPRLTARVDGDDITAELSAGTEPAAEAPVDDGEATARVSLRVSDGLKRAVDEAAAREGVSVNTWLVRAAGQALGGRPDHRRGSHHRLTGWVSG